uniref:AlNc14C411G11457 protein n=1 Tax=Albugo laibachii Nc14 TaxID=890382 RepID=F0WZ49_9STRA|nr:AlNc14C411G11457 [Albugo laibachii Nc14]|eukprot:CCA26764.1 AlNc14C411G11457 [Albugo laibachii Nc14]
MDKFTIAPQRHGKLVRWESASSWWKQAYKMWHQIDWNITISHLTVLQRRQYYMQQPVWFRCDRVLHYEVATRNPNAETVWYNLGMVDEPHLTFRKSFAQVFEIRSLQDFFRDCDTWLTKQEFNDQFYNDEELNTSDMAEDRLLG